MTVRTRYLRPTREDGGSITIIVADTGHGISPDLMPRIFDPFLTTKGEKGAGLGLWIVKGVVANHDGRLRVRSKVGKGTVVKIHIPHSR